jgi:hypothetical protein
MFLEMVDKLYHRDNPRSSFRPIARLTVELQRFVCDRATGVAISGELTDYGRGCTGQLNLNSEIVNMKSKRLIDKLIVA